MRIVKLTNETKENILDSLLKRSPNSYGEFDVRGKKYYIVPAAGEDATDVEFKTYIPYLEYALHLNGAIAGSKYNYDILVALDYDIEDASYEYHYSTPVYGATSIQSAETKFYGNNTAVTTYKYNTEVVGYQTNYKVVNQWTRYAAVYIYTKEGSDRIMQWKGYVESTGKLDRLIEVFPAMMFTLSRVLGQRVTDYRYRENEDFVDNYFANGKLYIEGYKPVKYTHVTKQDYRHCLIPEYIKQDYDRTTILFSTWSKKNGDYYAIKLGQDTYISCNNQRYKMLSSSITPEKRTIVDVKNVYDKLEIEDEILDKDNIRKYDPLTYCDNYVKSINYCLQTNQLFDNNNSKISSLTNMLFLLFEINDYTEEYKLYLELREFIRKGYRIDNYINYRKDNKFPLLNSILEQEDFKNYEEDDIYEGDYIYGSLLLHNNIEELDDLIRDIDSNLGEQTIVFTNISTSTKILSKDPHYIDLVVNTREYINNNNFYIVDSYPKNIKDEKRYSISYPFVNNEEFNKNFDVKRIKDGIIKISAKETITKENLKLLDILGLTIYVGKKTDTDVVIEVKEVNTVDLFEQSINNIYSKLLIDINKNKNIGKEIKDSFKDIFK